jgi:hypothetical protein
MGDLVCNNLFCKLNKCGFCDAANMMDILCNNIDFYNQCKEKSFGEDMIGELNKLLNKRFIKNLKGEIGYAQLSENDLR